MKYSPSIISVSMLISSAFAFPAGMMEALQRSPPEELKAIAKRLESSLSLSNKPRQAITFDASAQYISTTGQYAYVPPSSTDLRGPCPGLNALANHNYLPHNGYATIAQFINATNNVFGMGLDLAALLSIYGAVIDGDGTGWSIGGPAPVTLLGGSLNSLGLFSTPQGISGSHNKYESDVSPTRGDLYEYGNDYLVQLSQFQDLFSTQPDAATANYNLDVLTDFRAKRFQQSIDNNPYFFNGPFSGIAVQPAAYTFIYRFMANKSAEFPEGILDQDVLKSFFAITGDSGHFIYNPGQERIPDNWYKRAIGDEYTIPFFATDLNLAALKYPQFLDIGGNTGTVNSFTGVNLKNLTGGIFNAQNFAQGNNAACFAFQLAQQATPDLVKGLVEDVASAIAKIANAVSSVISVLGCPQLMAIDDNQFAQFPGYTKSTQ